ncbi:hypothetical protein C8034_v008934 [Colletotrichum sidae]|uniref:Uncharacterized protein n=1 Tax=Colletotrichum sidae TaxID=1347389 RepID=A0A4R8TNJ4_9PEZI|nr:hypothetical protein C8034_v008934 [Colletotrichum sidae]
MIPIRLRHANRTFQRLPLPVMLAPGLLRFPSPVRQFSNVRISTDRSRFATTRPPASNRSPLWAFNPDDSSTRAPRREHEKFDHVLQNLGIRFNRKEEFTRIEMPSRRFPAAAHLISNYSTRHVLLMYDKDIFGHPGESAEKMERRVYYVAKERDQPLWIWRHGSYGNNSACVVINLRLKLMKALVKSLWARGYDIRGRKVDTNGQRSPREDLRGTLVFHSNTPLQFKTCLTMKEIQQAVDHCIDTFIRATNASPRGASGVAIRDVSRRTVFKETKRLDPSLEGLPYRPFLSRKDKIARDVRESEQSMKEETKGTDEMAASPRLRDGG